MGVLKLYTIRRFACGILLEGEMLLLILSHDEQHEPHVAQPHTVLHNDLLFGDRFLPGQHNAALQATQNEEFSTEGYLIQADAASLKQVFLLQKDHPSYRTQTAPQEAPTQVATDGSVPIGSASTTLLKTE
jgi:hypothetical protein